MLRECSEYMDGISNLNYTEVVKLGSVDQSICKDWMLCSTRQGHACIWFEDSVWYKLLRCQVKHLQSRNYFPHLYIARLDFDDKNTQRKAKWKGISGWNLTHMSLQETSAVLGIVLCAHLLITSCKPCGAPDPIKLQKASSNCNAIQCTEAARNSWKEFKHILHLNSTRYYNNSLFL